MSGMPFKTVSINDLPESAWVYLTGSGTETASLQDHYKRVPWMFRGVDIRANAVAAMPFSIYKGEDEIDNSDNYKNAVKVLPNPKRLFNIIESALTIWGYAYAMKERNRFITTGLRYLLPTSITYKINSTTGEVSFTRRIAGQTMYFTADDIMYWWAADPFTEIGPPSSSPAQAAASAAGVLFNVDKFASAFFERGAIKATLLTTKNILPQEMSRLKAWWQRMFGKGSDSAWQTDIINAEAVTPVVIGEGLESLENSDLSESKRIDIAAALGIPYSVLFSNASNRATAEQDDLHLYTKTIIPECEFIAEVINDQLLEGMGYHLEFTPENLDVFQEDENARAASLTQLITALDKPEEFLLAADILGFDIAPDVLERIAGMIDAKNKRRDDMAQLAASAAVAREEKPTEPEKPVEMPQETPESARSVDMERWRTKSMKLVKRGKSPVCEFTSEHISPVTKAAIMGALEHAATIEEVKAIFDDVWQGYP